MLLKQILEDEPPRPRKLNQAIPGDLETICLKCLEKEPANRYATAQELADELRRFLDGEAIQAKPPRPAVRAWRWCRRHPLVVGLSLASVLVLAAGTLTREYLATRTTQPVADLPTESGNRDMNGGSQDATPAKAGPAKPSATPSKPAEESPNLPVVTQGPPVDLLALIDPTLDRVNGDWRKDGTTLVCGEGLGFRIEVPYVPPDEYVLTAEAERLSDANTFLAGLVSGGHQFNVMLDYKPRSGSLVSALENVDGRNFGSNETKHEGAVLPAQGRFQVVCSVRREGVTVDVDGRRIIDWHGDPSRLSRNDYWKTPHDALPFIGAYLCSYRVHRLELKAISGVGIPLRPVAPSKAIEKEGSRLESNKATSTS